MKRRSVGLGMVLGAMVLASASMVGCGNGKDEGGVGTLSVPLVSQGASGTSYRLRNATFQISQGYYYYDIEAGAGGAPGQAPITVSSEDDPDARAISVSLERGSYIVRLLPGWKLEKVENGNAEQVEATLLSNSTQWVYVSPHSSTTTEFEFGIGGRSIWFNGDLNIQIHVYEDPSEIYGPGGAGAPGAAGAPSEVGYGGYGG